MSESEEEQITVAKKTSTKLTITGMGVALSLVAQLVYGAMEWQRVNDMEGNHEGRISKLEGFKADATAASVIQQNNQIEKLIVAVQTDHDSIITLKAIFESQSRKSE